MKVNELIKHLQDLNMPDAEVIIASNNFELQYARIPLSSITVSKTASSKTETFRDAFDNETFEVETWSMYDGNLNVIHLG